MVGRRQWAWHGLIWPLCGDVVHAWGALYQQIFMRFYQMFRCQDKIYYILIGW
ncbi:hypothetical protein NB231_02328 [Nitrococcus mobilis Nb-231]|uniref:Uncharacterized protein n=1 Tax=Nitrococcus mobilis Nb-231 TaxID=314278 RepID=A4BRJ5_9GAMM|nr:hypothetical protein NB231_02328 [Nitrococcus mobilis Nb-231]